MKGFYLIGKEQVTEFMDMKSTIERVEMAYTMKAKNKTTTFPVITHAWEVDTKDMDMKFGCMDGGVDIYGAKLLTYMEKNDQYNLPRLSGIMLVFQTKDGQLKGMLDSGPITGMRTGAAGALGTKYLARKDAETLLLVGSGNQAFYNFAGHLFTMTNLKQVFVYDPISPELAERFAKEATNRLHKEILCKYEGSKEYATLLEKAACQITAITNLAGAVAEADIITTVTPSRIPLIKKSWVKPGTHFNCIGSDMEGKQEIEEMIFDDAYIVVDDKAQALRVGETEIPAAKGIVTLDNCTEIGDVIIGKQKGRTDKDQITIFDTTGLAIQDLAVADLILTKARKYGLPQYTL